jgi:hypothetical protein
MKGGNEECANGVMGGWENGFKKVLKGSGGFKKVLVGFERFWWVNKRAALIGAALLLFAVFNSPLPPASAP